MEQTDGYVASGDPRGSIAAYIPHEVAARLNGEAMRGFGITRRRGTEAGGLLLGRVERTGDATTVLVEDFEAVPCEYAFGPSYLLSPADRRRFAEAVARHRTMGAERTAVGFYRSHTREDLALDDADLELFREHFHEPYDVAVLVKPFATRPSHAAVTFPNCDGCVAAEFDLIRPLRVQVPDEPAPDPLHMPAETPPPPPKEIEPEPEPETAVEPPEPPPPRRGAGAARDTSEQDRLLRRVLGSRAYRVEEDDGYWNGEPDAPSFGGYGASSRAPRWRRRLVWLLYTLAAIAFGGAAVYHYGLRYGLPGANREPMVATPADPFTAGLAAEPHNGSLAVRWNRDALPVKHATRGVLSISEGPAVKEVQLGYSELNNGTVLYNQASTEVSFRLELLFNDNRRYVESYTWRAP